LMAYHKVRPDDADTVHRRVTMYMENPAWCSDLPCTGHFVKKRP